MKGSLSVATFGAALACAGLFGCGGGGGGGGGPAGLPQPPSSPIAISASNIGQVTDAALDPAVGGTGVFGAATSSAATSQPNTQLLLRAMQAVSSQAKKPSTSSSGLSDAPVTQNCAVSGTVTVDSTPTSATIQFNNCSDVLGEVINGSVSATGVSETATTFAASFSVDLTFTVSGSQSLRMVGAFSISENCPSGAGSCVGTFSGSSLGAAHGSEVWFISSFSITSVQNGSFVDVSVSYRVSSSHLNGSVQVITNGPIRFASGANYPESGIIEITGAGTTKALITITSSDPVLSNAVQVQLDVDGIAGYESTQTFSWTQLEAI